MKTLILAFVGALTLSTGAATGVAVSRNRAAAELARAHADSVKAADSSKVKVRVIGDSTDTLSARHDSTSAPDSSKAQPPKAGPAPVPATTADAPAGVPATKPDTAHAVKQAGKSMPQSGPPLKTSADSVVGLSEKRIAKAFASMAPKDAAKVFEVMSDADVGVILASLSDKESGAILAKLPPERVAAISRASLRAHGGGGK